MIRVLLDTPIWLDIAKRRDGQRWVVSLRVFASQGGLEILAPQIVLDEFTRNRPRIEASVSAAVSERFRQIRRDLHEYGDTSRLDWLDEMSHQVPMVSAAALQNFGEIAEMLDGRSRRLSPSQAEHERVVERALRKIAPMHRPKNSIAHTLLIEMYSSVAAESGDGDICAFATSNYDGFSVINGDRREPHPDIAAIFDGSTSQYLCGVEGLNDALTAWFGDEFVEMSDEFDILHDEPRTSTEILAAEREFFDKVWYVRSLIHDEKVERRPGCVR